MNTKEDLLALIHSVGLGHRAADLERLMKPSIRLRTRRVDEDALPLGASKFGGLPDLPPQWEWPVVPSGPSRLWADGDNLEDGGGDGGPLCFLAQFNLAEVAPYDVANLLPASGMLYFFCAIWTLAIGHGSSQCWRVLYHEGDLSGLTRRPIPPVPEATQNADYEPEGHQFPACAVEMSSEMTLPDLYDLPFDNLIFTREENDRYWDLRDRMEARPWTLPGNPTHRLLGYPQTVQGEMQTQCAISLQPLSFVPSFEGQEAVPKLWSERYELERSRRTGPHRPDTMRLLFQVDTDQDNDLNWQGLGRGYFWMQADRLRARDFSKVWLMMQCT